MQESLQQRLTQLPLILTGPIVRRVQLDQVTVWVALRAPRHVTLRVFGQSGSGWQTNPAAEATARTIIVGDHLHIVAVTARPTTALTGGQTYGYNLSFATPMDWVDNLPTGDLFTPGILAATAQAARGLLTYTAEVPGTPTLPSFVLPPPLGPNGTHPLNGLRFLHGSCRKPHGEGLDTMPGIDGIIKESLRSHATEPRPHFLVLSGDQIYADDVAAALLSFLIDAGDTLLGWTESLPNGQDWDFRPRWRASVAKHIHLTSSEAFSHLMRLGEFLTMYLFTWSDVLWPHPQTWPTFDDLFPAPEPSMHAEPLYAEEYRKHVDSLQKFHSTLPKVRRALASIPTLMIFDDHEITDDWNLTREFMQTVYDEANNPMGRRVVMNGLLAYALCQGWGNTPEQFTIPTSNVPPGGLLLTAIEQWRGGNTTQQEEIRRRFMRLLNVPLYQSGQRLDPPGTETPIRWHYHTSGPGYELIVIDTRTMRGFPGGLQDPPDLLPPAALNVQVQQVPPGPQDGVTLLVCTTNVVSEPLHELAVEMLSEHGKVYTGDAGDAWVPQSPSYERLLGALAQRSAAVSTMQQGRVVFLSGDVHYGFAARLQYWADRLPQDATMGAQAIFAHLTASSFKNEDDKTRALHERAFLQVRSRRFAPNLGNTQWIGWRTPLTRSDYGAGIWDRINRAKEYAYWQKDQNRLFAQTPSLCRIDNLPEGIKFRRVPDWVYRIDFLPDRTPPPPLPQEIYDPQASAHDRMVQVIEIWAAYKELARHGHGRAVVGHTNLGEVTFRWGPTEAVASQRLWWHLLESVELTPLTRYEVTLLDYDFRFPKPIYPPESTP